MPDLGEWFNAAFRHAPEHEVALSVLLVRLLTALVLGAVVGIVYRITHRNAGAATPSFVATLVLLAVIIAMVTMVVGESGARAFTLVGALSIVRFRTVVEDTRDTAFVIFSVVVGMACGLGKRDVALIGLAVVGAAAILLSFIQRYTFTATADWSLELRVGPGGGNESAWDAVFARLCTHTSLQSSSTARQGAALDLIYHLRLKPGVTPLQVLQELNRIESIQNLGLKRIA
jgi:uncharacterized membrane protein YhiD involved in acid resistance